MGARHVGHVGILVGLIAACGGGGKSAPAPKLADGAPVVADPQVLLGEDQKAPPILVMLNADGSFAVADAPKVANVWDALSTKPPRNRGVAVSRQIIGPIVKEAAALGTDVEPSAKAAARGDAVDFDVEPPPPTPDDEDPPPPEPEDEELMDDESDGTGTAMALEEGKMGQYNMRGAADDHARQQALDQARRAGVLGKIDVVAPTGSAFDSLTGTGPGGGAAGWGAPGTEPGMGPGTGWPSRRGSVAGTRPTEHDRDAVALVVAAPATPAVDLIDLLGELGRTRLAVNHQGRLRALRLGFGLVRGGGLLDLDTQWVEIRVSSAELVVETVPSPPATIPSPLAAPLDTAALAKAYTAARAALGDTERTDVDVLVTGDIPVQRLVDILAALDAAGATSVAIGRAPAPDSDAAKLRGKRIPRTTADQPTAHGDLDKTIIRRYVKRKLPEITACYEKALLTNQHLAGTVQTQFFITPDGTVAAAAASGVDDEVAACVAGVIKTIQFPEPRGGGGVQVNYPFTFRH